MPDTTGEGTDLGARPFSGTSRFEILRRLGAGGMGVVYEALDRERGSRVALKTMRELSGPEVLRLKNEFRALQNVQHPNLVTLGELFEEAGQWFFTMELVKGVDFVSHVRHRSESFDEARLRNALSDLTRALVTLHEAGMIHRDLKPENVVVTDDGRVVLVDFGLAAAKPEVQPGDRYFVFGTASYMAPEQATARLIGPEADMYSLGVILYEALTGLVPLSGQPQAILREKQQFRVAPPASRDPRVPRDLDQLCVKLMDPDASLRPTAREVMRALSISDDHEPRRQRTAGGTSPPFVGRRRELSQLLTALGDVGPDRAVAVYLRGESGIGKSTLSRRFLDQVRELHPGALLLSGRCYERESVPYKAFDDVLDALARFLADMPTDRVEALVPDSAGMLAQVFPVLGQVGAIARRSVAAARMADRREQRARVFAAMRELFGRVARRYRLVLVVDDLQWADDTSLALFEEILRPPDAPPLLLVGTFTDATGALAELVSKATVLELKRLGADESLELATSLIEGAGSSGSDVSAQVMAMESGGNPLFISELVRHAVHRHGRGAPPVRLEEALWSRLETLPHDTRLLLKLICAAGAPVAQEAVAHAMEVSREEFTKHLSALRSAHLVRTAGGGVSGPLEPYHQRFRDAVLANLEPELAIKLHERLARGLEATGKAGHDALAIHWMGCGEGEKASMYAFLAAEQAVEALAFERAAQLYLMAMKSDPDAGSRLWELQVKLGDALANCGHGAEAAAAYLAASHLIDRGQALEMRWRAAEQYLLCGHIDEGLEQFESVVAGLGLRSVRRGLSGLLALWWQRVRVRVRGTTYKVRRENEVPADELRRIDVSWSVSQGLATVDAMRAFYFVSLNLRLALDAGEPYRLARALSAEAVFSGMRGVVARRRTSALLEQAESLAEECGNPHGSAVVMGCSSVVALMQGRFRGATELAAQAERLLRERCTGAAWEIDTLQIFSLIAMTYLGEVAELSRRQRIYLREARERGDNYLETCCQIGMLNLSWLVQDDPEGGRRAAQEAMQGWSTAGFQMQHYWELLARAHIDLYVGDGEAAWARIQEHWGEMRGANILGMQLLRVEAKFLRARAALARYAVKRQRKRLLLSAEYDARALERERVDYASALAHIIRAGVAALRDREGDALRELALAEDELKACGMLLLVAAVKRHRGVLLGGAEGAELIRAADEWMAGQGIRAPERMAAMFCPGFARLRRKLRAAPSSAPSSRPMV